MDHSKKSGNAVHATVLKAILGGALLVAAAGCGGNSGQPSASPSNSTPSPATSASVPTSTSPGNGPDEQGTVADAIAIGASGVRCCGGKTTVGCATMMHKGMVADGQRTLSFFRSSHTGDGVEPGFTPGKHVQSIAVGDLVLLDASACGPSGTGPDSAPCDSLTITDAVTAENSKKVDLGVISVVNAQGMTICSTDTQFDYPGQPIAQAGQAVFRPDPGRQLDPGQSMTIRDWTFKLDGQNLTITSPGGATNVVV